MSQETGGYGGGPRAWRAPVRRLGRAGVVYKSAMQLTRPFSRWLRRHQINVQCGGLPGDPCVAEVMLRSHEARLAAAQATPGTPPRRRAA